MKIRQSHDQDIKKIMQIHLDAFGAEEGPVVSELIKNLLNDPTADPKLSLLAEESGDLIGHITFSKVEIKETQQHLETRILGPLAVAPKAMKQGIGSKLVNAGCEQLMQSGVNLVLVYGDPNYYSRFGFTTAGKIGVLPPYPIPVEYEEAWMIKKLTANIPNNINSKIKCCKALDDPIHW